MFRERSEKLQSRCWWYKQASKQAATVSSSSVYTKDKKEEITCFLISKISTWNLSYTHLNILAGEMKSHGSLSQYFLLSLGNNTKKICETEKETYPSRQATKSIEKEKRKCYLKVLRDFLWVSSLYIRLALNVDPIWDFDVPFLPFDSRIWWNEFPLCCQRTLKIRGKNVYNVSAVIRELFHFAIIISLRKREENTGIFIRQKSEFFIHYVW